MRDNVNVSQRDFDKMALKLSSNGIDKVHMTGESIDKIYKNGELVQTIVGHNLVINSFLNLVMCLLKQQSGYAGIQYWAVGSGADAWDGSIPNPDIKATRLTYEIGRVPISRDDLSFLDKTYDEVSTPTNILQIKHTFGTDDCNGVWREFGIFGGNATADAGSGIMINKRHHEVITKTSEMMVERVMRFTLNLS